MYINIKNISIINKQLLKKNIKYIITYKYENRYKYDESYLEI